MSHVLSTYGNGLPKKGQISIDNFQMFFIFFQKFYLILLITITFILKDFSFSYKFFTGREVIDFHKNAVPFIVYILNGFKVVEPLINLFYLHQHTC